MPSPLYFSVNELRLLIKEARKLSLANEVYVRLQAQAGLRPEEAVKVTPSMFDHKKSNLYLPSSLTKQYRNRVVPLYGKLPVLLQSMSMTSFPSEAYLSQGEPLRLAQIPGFQGGMLRDLRLSYAIYRCAQVGNILKVAHEMGATDYFIRALAEANVVSQAEADNWFAI